MTSRMSRSILPAVRPVALVLALVALALAVSLPGAPIAQAVDICGRTAEVEDAILAKVKEDRSAAVCTNITSSELSGITELVVSGYSAAAIVPGDFSGLTGLTDLSIHNSNTLTSLPDSAFTNASALTTLDLRGNAISSMHKDALDGITALETLDLGYNHLADLPPEFFDGESAITKLNLQSNFLKIIENWHFDGLSGLTHLTLDNNVIKRIEENAFADVATVTHLKLAGNSVDVGIDTFDAFTALELLDLRRNGIDNLHADTFDGYTSLGGLDLGENNLTGLPATIFGDLSALTGLNLSGNNISALHVDIFDSLEFLNGLNLSDNNLTAELPSDIFAGTSFLTDLNLSGNGLTSLHEDTFDGLQLLFFLRLNDNALTSLHANLFADAYVADTLDLSDNNISSTSGSPLDTDIFDGQFDLNTLDLSGNSLNHLHVDTFEDLTGLCHLYLSDNDLSSPNVNLFDDLANLVILHLDDNSITSLPTDLFDGLDDSLQELSVDGNTGLTTLHVDIFDGLTDLERLSLAGNGITATGLPAGVFADLDEDLEFLSLTDNDITTLTTTGTFAGLTGLKSLSLACNDMTALTVSLLDPFKTVLTFLDISGNSFATNPTISGFTALSSDKLHTGTTSDCYEGDDVSIDEITSSAGDVDESGTQPVISIGSDVTELTITMTPNDSEVEFTQPGDSGSAFTAGRSYELNDNDTSTEGIQIGPPLHRKNVVNYNIFGRDGTLGDGELINVYRAAEASSIARLSDLSVGALTLSPTFDTHEDTYTATTPAMAGETAVTATTVDPDATYVVKLGGTTDADGSLALSVGTNTITVEVTAEDTTTTKTYTVTVTVTPPTVEIADAEANEGDDVVFTVSLSATTNTATTVEYATVDDTALAGTHYTAKSGTLTIAANTMSSTISVDTEDDSKDDVNYAFTVTLSSPSGATLGTMSSATGTIKDDDPVPNMSIGTPSALDEGDSGTKTMTFAVSLNTVSNKTVTVEYATEELTGNTAATAGDDFTATSGTLTFSPGEMSQDITVDVLGDELDENNETFRVRLSSWQNTGVTRGTATGTITDDDDPPALSITGETAREDAGTIDFVIALDPESGRDVVVQYATLTTGTALSGTDFTAKSGTLTFAEGETSKTVEVTVRDDSTDEDDETLLMRISSPTNATIATEDREAIGIIENEDDPPTISINDRDITETNSSVDFNLTATLNAASGKTVTVEWETADDTATAGSDYTTRSGTLTFSPGARTRNIGLRINGDTKDEFTETFTVDLSSPTNGTISDGSGTVSILDNDPRPNLRIGDAQQTETDAASNLIFNVNLTAASGKEVTVAYATSGGTAVEGTDYTAASGTLTFAEDVTHQAFTVTITGDTLDEHEEQFTVNLSSATNAGVSDATGTGTIVDNDPAPALSIDDNDAAENVGAGEIDFEVKLDAESGKTVTVAYATLTTGTATSNVDYTHATGTLTFSPGSTDETLSVTLVDDSTDEHDEDFTVRLSSPSNATLATADRDATGTINDNDPAPGLSIADAEETEPDGSATAPMTFTVTLDAESGKTVTVEYATSGGTATSGTDFNAASGTLTFSPGDTEKTFTVAVRGDDIHDAATDETFTVTLSSQSNASLTDATATGTIVDNEGPPRLQVLDASVTEGNAGSTNLTFTVEKLGGTALTVTTAWATVADTGDEAATVGEDYTAGSGTLTFTPSQTRRTMTVAVLGDKLDEYDETFSVTISSPSNATIRMGGETATMTITDNDPLPRVKIYSELRWQPPGEMEQWYFAQADEGDPVVFPVTLSAASGRDVEINYQTTDSLTSAQTAVPGADYTAVTGATLTFTAGERLAFITITTIDDSVRGVPGDFDVLLILPSDPHARFGTARAKGSIHDDEADPSFIINEETADEDDGTISFEVALSPESGQDSTVQWRTSVEATDTATSGRDFTAASGTLTFAAGETSKTITVSLADDSLDEVNETFTVTLSDASGAQIGTATATGTITDDDDAPAASVAPTTVREAGGRQQVAVNLAEQSGRTVTLTWRTGDDTATMGDDYTAVTAGTLTFAPGVTTANAAVEILQDTIGERDETFSIILASPDGSADTSGAGAMGTVTITDDEPQPRLSIGDAEAYENAGPMTFTVTLTPEAGYDVTVLWDTAEGTATAPEDFTAQQGQTLTIDAGSTTGNIPVTLINDNVREGDKTFTVELRGANGATISDNMGTGTILDDEGPPRLSIADAEVAEGASGTTATMTFTVTMTGDPAQDVTFTYRTSGQSATQGTDYELGSGTATFDQPTGETTKQIGVVVRGDDEYEGDETFTVMLSNAREGSERVEILDDEAVGTIRDDDPGVSASPNAMSVPEGGSAEYELRVQTDPGDASDVTIEITSNNADVTVVPQTLTIAHASWETAQTVTVTAAQDTDGSNDSAQLTHAVSNYPGVTDGPTVRVTVTDDERSSILPRTGGGGGGGGGGGSSNQPPEVSGPRSIQYPEHGTEPVGTYTAVDPEGTEISSWTIEDTDAEHFQISEDGVLTFVNPPDYEKPVDFRLNNTYEIRLIATDSGVPRASGRLQVRIEIRDVNEIGPLVGASNFFIEEGRTGVLARYQAEDPEGDAITWSVTGPDAAFFHLDEEGNLSLTTPLDFEVLGSAAGTNDYSVTVVATDDDRRPASAQMEVMISVANADEEGTIAMPDTAPRVRSAIAAELTDPDGGVAEVTWVWERSADGSVWDEISGATSASYTPVEADVGAYLRVRATYTDTLGPSKSAMAALADVVEAFSLQGNYDADSDGVIGLDEAVEAVTDYREGGITRDEALTIVNLYFES